MTDQHPLTDDIIDTLASPQYDDFGGDIGGVNTGFTCDDLRAAADWQLEHVLKWLKANLMKHVPYEGYAYLFDDCSNAYIKQGALLKDLQKAMRPTTTQENSQ